MRQSHSERVLETARSLNLCYESNELHHSLVGRVTLRSVRPYFQMPFLRGLGPSVIALFGLAVLFLASQLDQGRAAEPARGGQGAATVAASMPQPTQDPWRFLFVVDISSSMSRNAENTYFAISQLITNGVQGQLRAGEVFQIWTFNDQVFTNRLGPLAWDPLLNQALATRVLKGLRAQRFERDSRWDRLWPVLKMAAAGQELLTVILISDGFDSVSGTPFDKALNDIYQKYRRELRRLRKPFVTTLVAHNGQFAAYTVNATGSPIAFDQLAKFVPLPASLSPAPAPEPAEAPSLAPAIVASNPPPDIKPIAPAPEAPALASTPAPGVAPVTNRIPEESRPEPPPAPVVSSVQKTNNVPATNSVAAHPPVKSAPESNDVAVTPPPASVVHSNTASPPLRPIESSAPKEPRPVLTEAKQPTHSNAATVSILSSAQMAQTKTVSPVPKPIVNSRPPETSSRQSSADRKAEPDRAAASASPQNSKAPPIGAVVPPESWFGRRGYLIAAGVAVVVISGLLVWVLRRSRGSKEASLISQSIERQLR